MRFPVTTSHMYLWTHLNCGWTTVDGLPLQSDFAAIRPEAGPIPQDSGMLKQEKNHPQSSIFDVRWQKRDHIKHNHRQSSHWPLDSAQADRLFPRFPYDLRKCCVHSSFQSGKHHRRSPGCFCRHIQDNTLEIITGYKTVVVIQMWNKEFSHVLQMHHSSNQSLQMLQPSICQAGWISALPWNDVRAIVDPLSFIMGQNPMLEPRSVHLAIKTNNEVLLNHVTNGGNFLWLL